VTTTFFTKDPRELDKLVEERDDFPYQELTELLRLATWAIHDYVDCPIGLAAMSVLGAASLALQGHFNIVMPTTEEAKPISLYLATIAESGERKSTADHFALVPVAYHERVLYDQYKPAKEQYVNESVVYSSAYDKIVKDKNISAKERLEKILALGLKPESPLQPFMTCGEPTIEGLLNLFHTGRPSLGLFSDEGGAFVGGYSMKDDNRLTTAAHLSHLWDGTPVKRVRKNTDDTFMLPGRRLTFHLMMQPSVAMKLYGMPDIRNQGIFSRVLVCYPESRIGVRWQREIEAQSKPALHSFYHRLDQILATPLPVLPNNPQVLRPRNICLSREAIEGFGHLSEEAAIEGEEIIETTRSWQLFANKNEDEMRDGNSYQFIRGFASKMGEHVCRIAAVMQLFQKWDAYRSSDVPIEIDAEVFERAARITNFFADQLLQFFEVTDECEVLEDAKKFNDWLYIKWNKRFIQERDIANSAVPSSIRGKANEDRRNRVIQLLVDAGWLAPVPWEAFRDLGIGARVSTRIWEVWLAGRR
jgi:hypothetical protein